MICLFKALQSPGREKGGPYSSTNCDLFLYRNYINAVRDNKPEEIVMKNIMIHRTKLAFLLILAVTFITSTADAQVVCNKFKLVTKVTGSTLDLSLDTDLPDNAVVMVSVSRSYMEKGNTSEYSVDYFSEKSTVRKWKSKHRISIDSKKWKSALRKKQEKMSRLGLGFDVASISEKITARMVAPINQPDPRFGKQNSKLTGNAVRATSIAFH